MGEQLSDVSLVRLARLTRLDAGKICDSLQSVPDDAVIEVEFPSEEDNDFSFTQVIVGAGIGTYVPGGTPNPDQPRDRVSNVITLSADFPSGTYDRPVTEAEDHFAWVRNGVVPFQHVVSPMTVRELKQSLAGLPRRMQVDVYASESPGDMLSRQLYVCGTSLETVRGGRSLLTLEARDLPLELALEQTPPEGPRMGFSL